MRRYQSLREFVQEMYASNFMSGVLNFGTFKQNCLFLCDCSSDCYNDWGANEE